MYVDIFDFLSHVQSEQSYVMHRCLMDIKSHRPQESLVYLNAERITLPE